MTRSILHEFLLLTIEIDKNNVIFGTVNLNHDSLGGADGVI